MTRSTRLRIIEAVTLPPDWEMQPGTPATRGDCKDGQRPCPYVECRHHLWTDLEQDQSGNWQRGRQGSSTLRPSTMESCSLDIAEHGAMPEDIGLVLGMDDTRVRQILEAATEKLRRANPVLAEYLETR